MLVAIIILLFLLLFGYDNTPPMQTLNLTWLATWTSFFGTVDLIADGRYHIEQGNAGFWQ